MHYNKLFFCFIIALSILFRNPTIRAEGEIQNIEDNRSTLKSPLTNRFQVKYEGLSASGVAFDVLSILDEAYYDVGNDLGYFPEKPIEVIIYTSKKYQTPSVIPDWATGLYDGRIHLKIGDLKKGREHLKYIVYHEYTHALLRQWIKQDIPVWLDEGLATYEGLLPLKGRYIWKIPLKYKDFSLTELDKPFYRFQKPQEAHRSYQLCKEIISYLVKRYGKYRLKDLLEELSEGKDFNSAFLKVYNLDIVRFEEDLKRYFRRIKYRN